MKDIDKELFKELVTSMLKSFDNETLSSGLYQHLLENVEWFKEPETINIFIMHPVKKAIELIIREVHKKSREVTNLWMDYDFIERNISELCSNFYGSACCVDRGTFITDSLIKFKETGEMKEFDWEQEYTYHYPETGTMKQWLDFAEGISELRYGLNTKYLKALSILIEEKSKKEEDKLKELE